MSKPLLYKGHICKHMMLLEDILCVVIAQNMPTLLEKVFVLGALKYNQWGAIKTQVTYILHL